MSEKRFVLFGLDNETIKDDVTKECYWVNEYVQRKKLVDLLNEQQSIIEQLQAQLLICQQSKKDDGRFQVWEVPPIPKGTRITFSTTERSGKNE